MITYDDFAKLDLRIGTITAADKVEGSRKLLKIEVRLGDEHRTIMAGVAKSYDPQEIIGKQVVIVYNLEPKIMAAGVPKISNGKGLESQGMILAADGNDGPIFLTVDKKVPDGATIK